LRCARDVGWRYFHRSLCRRFLSILETQRLFEQICKSSYFTFDALNFLLIMSLYLRPFFIFHLFSQSSVVDLRWGTYVSVFLRIYACKGTCMSNVWAYFYMMNSSFKGWHVVVMIAWWARILILTKTPQQKFPEWRPLCHP